MLTLKWIPDEYTYIFDIHGEGICVIWEVWVW